MSRFHPEQAGFHSVRKGRISLLILNSEIALTGSEILACGSSEIILCEDSEITAGTAVVIMHGSPKGCGIVSPD